MASERRNGYNRTVGRSHCKIDLLAMGEGPIGRQAKQEEELAVQEPTHPAHPPDLPEVSDELDR